MSTEPEPGRDLLQLGNLLMVAGDQGSLMAVDLSTTVSQSAPEQPGSYQVHAVASAGEKVRALATDGHNRVLLNALMGGTWSVKAVRLEDVRAAGSGCSALPAWADPETRCFAAVAGGVRYAWDLGYSSGLQASEWLALGALPSGTPVDLEVIVRDEVGKVLEPEELVTTHIADPSDPEPPTLEDYAVGDGSYAIPVADLGLRRVKVPAIASLHLRKLLIWDAYGLRSRGNLTKRYQIAWPVVPVPAYGMRISLGPANLVSLQALSPANFPATVVR